ncbi:MAG: molybdopterin-dependent oxidoreductase, partial [bacterium]
DEGAYYADLILPTSSYLEKVGTYVNTDGRP